MDFKVVLEKDNGSVFTAIVSSLPACIPQGKTEEVAKKNMKEAIGLHISLLEEDGTPIKHDKNIKET